MATMARRLEPPTWSYRFVFPTFAPYAYLLIQPLSRLPLIKYGALASKEALRVVLCFKIVLDPLHVA